MALRDRAKDRTISLLRRLEPLHRRLPPALALRSRLIIQRELGALEPEFALLPHLAAPDLLAIDAGANAGVFTLALSKLSRHVHAYEPIAHLARSLARARLKNVTVHDLALSDTHGTATLRVPVVDGRPRSTRASLTKPAERCTEYTVQMTTLDSQDLERIGFLKIDVEGHEYRVLQGATVTLSKDRPNVLVEIEADHIAEWSVDDVFSLMLRAGYDGFFYDRGVRRSISSFIVEAHQRARKGSRDYVNNFIFLPQDRDRELPERL